MDVRESEENARIQQRKRREHEMMYDQRNKAEQIKLVQKND